MNPSKSANTASECYNGVIIFATQSFRISVDSKKKWLIRDLWSDWIENCDWVHCMEISWHEWNIIYNPNKKISDWLIFKQ